MAFAEIVDKALMLFDLIFGFTKWWPTLKIGIQNVIILIEGSVVATEEGTLVPDKQKNALLQLKTLMDAQNIKIPEWVYTIVVPMAINLLVAALNKYLGKNWFTKLDDDDINEASRTAALV
ncbi:MAG: hypothetical protein KO464_02250 [Candidatus Methanofastidiosum sp.]|nr:hypothetical protein [Methanofastidiosum sp.]